MRIGIRQNSTNVFVVNKPATGGVVATAHMNTNFSCFGPLSIMLEMDMVIPFIYARAGYESAKWILGPRYKKFVLRHLTSRRVASSSVADVHTSEQSTKGPADASTLPTMLSDSIVRRMRRSRSA